MLMRAIALLLHLAAGPDTSRDCDEQVCLYASADAEPLELDAKAWQPEARLNRKQRKAEAKRNRKFADVVVRVVVEGGRGTAFVDGRYLASAGSHAERTLDPGKHEIEIRDGDAVLVGVLVVPRKATELTLVVHVDR